MTGAQMEQDALLFWKLARAHNAVSIALGSQCAEAKSLRLDIDCVAMHTDWPLLRERAEDVIAVARAQRARA